MPKYRKIPVVIEAEQFNPSDHTSKWPDKVLPDPSSPTGYALYTLEHTSKPFEVTPGDWIITGIEGEKYACKDSIFRKTYEPVE